MTTQKSVQLQGVRGEALAIWPPNLYSWIRLCPVCVVVMCLVVSVCVSVSVFVCNALTLENLDL